MTILSGKLVSVWTCSVNIFTKGMEKSVGNFHSQVRFHLFFIRKFLVINGLPSLDQNLLSG